MHRVCFILLKEGNNNNKKNPNVNTCTVAEETGYNQVIQREKIKPSIYVKFAFTSVNCKGMIVEKKRSHGLGPGSAKPVNVYFTKPGLNLSLFNEALTHAGAHGNKTCFSGLCCGRRASLHGGAGARQSVSCEAVRVCQSALSQEIIVVVVSIELLLFCQHYTVRRHEHCFKNFKVQKMSLLLLLLRYDCIVLLLCYYIALISSTTSCF